MPTDEASTPAPTYGRPASSSRPCTVPSSPKVPCSTGKITSTAMFGCCRGRRNRHQSRRSRIGRKVNRLAALQHFAQHFLGGGAGDPASVFGDSDRHCLIFFRIERANHRGGRGERDFVLARTSAENHANSQPLVLKSFGMRLETNSIFMPAAAELRDNMKALMLIPTTHY